MIDATRQNVQTMRWQPFENEMALDLIQSRRVSPEGISGSHGAQQN